MNSTYPQNLNGILGLPFKNKTQKRAVNLQKIAVGGLLAAILCAAIFFVYQARLETRFHNRMQDVNAVMEAKYGPGWQYRSAMAKDLQAAFKKYN